MPRFAWVGHVTSFGLMLALAAACSGTSSTCGGGARCVQDGAVDATQDGASTGATCGGFLGLDCEGGEFCDYEPSAFCGSGDQLGACREIPSVCTDEVAPVCGCDQQTYVNACQAAAASVSVSHTGACD